MSETDRLIALIEEAAADATRWSAVLEQLLLTLNARAANLGIQHPVHPEQSVFSSAGLASDDLRIYAERYAAADPWNLSAKTWPEGVVGYDHELTPRDAMEASPAFSEFYAPRDFIHGIGVNIIRQDDTQSFLSILRTAAQGPFGEPEQAILQKLVPHLRRAAVTTVS